MFFFQQLKLSMDLSLWILARSFVSLEGGFSKLYQRAMTELGKPC